MLSSRQWGGGTRHKGCRMQDARWATQSVADVGATPMQDGALRADARCEIRDILHLGSWIGST